MAKFLNSATAAVPLKKPSSAVEKWRLGCKVRRAILPVLHDLLIMKSLFSTSPWPKESR
jgi:hypothetical protein